MPIICPDMRCGKSTLLDLLNTLVPGSHFTTNISPTELDRVIAAERPALLMDEFVFSGANRHR
jgi:hypothetical protein